MNMGVVVLVVGVVGVLNLNCIGRTKKMLPPEPTHYVTNHYGVLSASQQEISDELEATLEQYFNSTHRHIDVYILSSPGDYDPGVLATECFNTWGLGDPELNDGVLFMIFVGTDYRVIRVGVGLENVLTDYECSRICLEIVKPKMHQGDLMGAIRDGVDEIITVLN